MTYAIEPKNYGDWSDEELADELSDLDKEITYWHKSLANMRRMLNSAIDKQDAILDVVKQRGQRLGRKSS